MRTEYKCLNEWDCKVNYGDRGIVFNKEDTYETAFFEAFPKEPKTFIRAEGDSIEEAEGKAWELLNKYKECPKHEYERRGYDNGVGFCKNCGMFKSKAFKPLNTCVICGRHTNWIKSKTNKSYCKEHYLLIPKEDQEDFQKEDFEKIRKENLSTLNDLKDFNYIVDCDVEYYKQHNLNELKHLELFMEEVFSEISFKLGFKNIANADTKDFCVFTVKNFGMAIRMFSSDHIYKGYKVYKKDNIELIMVELDERKDISFEDESKEEFVETGRTIKLFSLDTKYMKMFVEKMENS